MSTPFRPPISNMKTKRIYKKRKRPHKKHVQTTSAQAQRGSRCLHVFFYVGSDLYLYINA